METDGAFPQIYVRRVHQHMLVACTGSCAWCAGEGNLQIVPILGKYIIESIKPALSRPQSPS